MITVVSFDKNVLKLQLAEGITHLQFKLNSVVISEMIVTNIEIDYVINPTHLIMGMNQLDVISTDTEQVKSTKTLRFNKQLTSNSLNVGDELTIKGRLYTVTSNIDDVITLDKVLHSDVQFEQFIEKKTFKVNPYVAMTFYNEVPQWQIMNFVKSVYKDNKIEDEYELDRLEGTILNSYINVIRDDVTQEISLSNPEFILF